MNRVVGILIGVFLSMNVWAQMPHEVLLLVNKQSQASMQVANTYAAARQVPMRNIVYLDIPENIYGGTATITPEQFTQLIWEPANAAAKARGIDGQILAWIYSVDFPIRVKTFEKDRQQMSVGGLTFMRDKVPGPSLIEDGKYLSKLFMGPNERLKQSLLSISFRQFRDGFPENEKLPEEMKHLAKGLGKQMPLPNMMLGYIGEKGNDVQTVLDTIGRGVSADFRGMHSGIYFVMSDDVRSTCREWQYYPAVNELKQRGISATVTTNFPAGAKNVMGVMMGAEDVDPSAIGSFAPGAMAEHLTSWSAEFQRRQTKMTEWLKAGATGSAGAVVEPYSNPDKFPSARFYVHYVSGCTMLESFYQSIACPLQTLLLGDPLTRPYTPVVAVRLLGAEKISSHFTYIAKAESRVADAKYLYTFLLDGKLVQEESDNPSIYLTIYGLSDGYHELRVCARIDHYLDFVTWASKEIIVNQFGRSVSIPVDEIRKTGPYTHSIKVKIGGVDNPKQVRLIYGEMVLDEKEYVDDMTLTLDEQRVGQGPARIQAVAIYGDGMEVASAPLNITINFNP